MPEQVYMTKVIRGHEFEVLFDTPLLGGGWWEVYLQCKTCQKSLAEPLIFRFEDDLFVPFLNDTCNDHVDAKEDWQEGLAFGPA